jgi:hypothetical protein
VKHNPHSKAKVRCWTATPPPRPEPETRRPEPPPATRATNSETHVRHGYDLAAIDHLTRLTLRMDRWHTAGDIDDRFDAVRHAIVVHLLTAEEPPHRADLLATGTRASDDHVRDDMRTHGKDTNGPGLPMPSFYRYWGPTRGTSPETRVVERHAPAQIWPLLRPSEQRALSALAATGDYELAAEACGVTVNTFRVLVSTGRRRFLALWHEGEEPSTVWRTDRRVRSRDGRDHLGRQRLTTSQVDGYRERYQAGETLRSLGCEAGLSATGMSRLIRGVTKPVSESVS